MIKSDIFRINYINFTTMADITMCWGRGCPVKENCYRFMAKPDDYQSYFIDAPIRKGKCEHYWEIDKTFKKKSLWKKVNNKQQ